MDWSSLFPDLVQEDHVIGGDAETGHEQVKKSSDSEAATHSLLLSEENNETRRPEPRRLTQQVEVADLGCGFGGLLIALAPLMPDKLILGRARYGPARRCV